MSLSQAALQDELAEVRGHALFLALGKQTDERQGAYRVFFRSELDDEAMIIMENNASPTPEICYLSVKAIADKLHMSKSTLYNYLRCRGVEIGPHGKAV